jgi:thioredoxin 1
MTTHVSDANFGDEVLSSKEPVLVDFWAECGPSRAISPVLEELSTELWQGEDCEVDENPNVTVKYGVRSILTMILWRRRSCRHDRCGHA